MHEPADNRLLAALPDEEFQRLRPSLRSASFPPGKPVYKSDTTIQALFFPVSGIISLVHVMADGASAEVAVVGSEACLGLPLAMGARSAPFRAFAQTDVQGYRLSSAAASAEFRRGGQLHSLLLRCAHALLVQISQRAVCNRHHSLEQQLCRSLLLSFDRVPGNELPMTHERIAEALGARREGVSTCARVLQDQGLIRYSQGRIYVLDRQQLEARVCECYGIVTREYRRLPE